MVHSILIIGQSNMAGRGELNNAESLDNLEGKLSVLRNGRWQPMYRPVNPDRDLSGSCLAESFARAYYEDHGGASVGIIPCADGGTSLDQWQPGSLLFDNAVNCARLAMRTSNLVAILWHQGESDTGDNYYPLYLEKITKIMSELRHLLGAEDVPLLVGGLGDFLKDRVVRPHFVNYVHINDALKKFAKNTHRTAYVSAEGLTHKGDTLHFNHASLMEFGLRYYKAFREIEDKNRVFEEKSTMDSAIRGELEAL